MAEDEFDVEALLEAPYVNGVCSYANCLHVYEKLKSLIIQKTVIFCHLSIFILEAPRANW